jgi:hypothetical protein
MTGKLREFLRYGSSWCPAEPSGSCAESTLQKGVQRNHGFDIDPREDEEKEIEMPV